MLTIVKIYNTAIKARYIWQPVKHVLIPGRSYFNYEENIKENDFLQTGKQII